jgi:cytochrome c-550 PedF
MTMKRFTIGGVALTVTATLAFAHGDIAPQPVNTDALPDVGEEWLIENPYRADKVGDELWWEAVLIGDSGYNQNCARCHGLGVVSGGLAPDLRFLEAAEYGDEWFAERFQHGFTPEWHNKDACLWRDSGPEGGLGNPDLRRDPARRRGA